MINEEVSSFITVQDLGEALIKATSLQWVPNFFCTDASLLVHNKSWDAPSYFYFNFVSTNLLRSVNNVAALSDSKVALIAITGNNRIFRRCQLIPLPNPSLNRLYPVLKACSMLLARKVSLR